MTANHVDDAVAELAMSRHGAFSREGAIGCGASTSMTDRRVRSGAWIRVIEDVFLMRGAPPSWERDLHVAALAMPHGAVSHAAAAALHGLVGFREGPVVVTVLHGASRRSEVATVKQSRHFDPAHITTVRGLPVTTVARTIVDLAAVCRLRRLERVVDDAVASRLVTVEDIAAVFDDLARKGRRGVSRLRALLSVRLPGYVPPESALESMLLRVLRRGGLPRPALQYPFPGRSPGEERVDAAYPSARVVIEADSRRWHTRVEDFARDRARDNEAAAQGWRVLRFTWDDLHARPEWVCRTVRQTVRSRAA